MVKAIQSQAHTLLSMRYSMLINQLVYVFIAIKTKIIEQTPKRMTNVSGRMNRRQSLDNSNEIFPTQ